MVSKLSQHNDNLNRVEVQASEDFYPVRKYQYILVKSFFDI